MSFPVSVRGSLPIQEDSASVWSESVIFACADQIAHEGARVLSRTQYTVSFEVPLFRTGGGLSLGPVAAAGSFRVESTVLGQRFLCYDLSTWRTTIMGTALVLLMFGVMVPLAAGGQFPFPWPIPIVFWLWFVGGNYLLAKFRVRFWCLRRLLEAKAAPRLRSVRDLGAST